MWSFWLYYLKETNISQSLNPFYGNIALSGSNQHPFLVFSNHRRFVWQLYSWYEYLDSITKTEFIDIEYKQISLIVRQLFNQFVKHF